MDVSPEGTWSSKEVNLPNTGSIYVGSANVFDDLIFFSYEDHITPDTLFEFIPGQADLKPIKSLPARFDASNLVVEQFEAKSADGELVPYFLIRAKDTVFNGETPTILYGYGGFEISLTPSYSSTRGKLWLERGGAYAIANIREVANSDRAGIAQRLRKTVSAPMMTSSLWLKTSSIAK